MAVLEKNRIIPWQKKPTLTPKSNTAAIIDNPSQDVQAELVTVEPSSSPTVKEETPAESLETSDLTTSQSKSPSIVTEEEIPGTTAASEVPSNPEGQSSSLQGGDKVVVVKPPTAAAYKM